MATQRRQRRWRFAPPGRRVARGASWIPVVLLAMAACSLLSPGDASRDELERARERWEALDLGDYTYLVRRACACLPGTTGPFEVRVERGREPVVIRPEDGEELAQNLAGSFPSVEGLFDLIDDAIRRDAALMEVDYDRESGTPLYIYIDYDEGLADEEALYWATVPEPLE